VKVTFVTSESFIDHSYTMIEELRKHLDLKVFVQGKNYNDEIQNWCSICNAEFIQMERFRNPSRLKHELNLLKKVEIEKSDVIWFNTFSVVQAYLAKKRFKNLVVNIHDVELHTEEKDYHGILSQKITYRKFKERMCTMSHAQAEIFEKNNSFYPNVLQLPIINYYEKTSEADVPKEKNMDRIRFLFFGSTLPYKGIETLLDAVDILSEQTNKFELYIHGRLKYNIETLTKRFSDSGHINFFNEFVDYKNVYKLYSQNDVTVIPYKQVSQCGPLLISYNQNIPVITNDLPGFREYVDDNESGLIFNNSAESLAEKMKMIIDNPFIIKSMSSYISTRVKEKFSMPALAESYIKVFKKYAD